MTFACFKDEGENVDGKPTSKPPSVVNCAWARLKGSNLRTLNSSGDNSLSLTLLVGLEVACDWINLC